MKRKVLIAAGGTGGHLFPAQQLCEELRGEEFFFAGHGLTASPFFEREKIPFQEIASASTKKKGLFLLSALRGVWQSVALIRKFRPDVVVGFGSFHCFPVLVAAVILGKKIVLFEANCELGKVNRLFAPFSKKVALQFPLAKTLKNEQLVPLLPWSQKQKLLQSDARKNLRLDDQLTILVFGGSQGAAAINKTFVEAALLLKKQGLCFQVIHLTGKESEIVAAQYKEHGIPAVVKNFEREMHVAYGAADFVVCRSGAGTVAELIQYQKPAILIPYPFAGGHQKSNARYFTGIGGGRSLVQEECTAERLAAEVMCLSKEIKKRQEALRKFKARPTQPFADVIRGVMR